jgi:DNA-binding Xre family transcriptional regulator
MATYRLRSDRVLLHLAVDKGIKPSGSGIAHAAGLPATTVNALRSGRPPQASTMASLVRLFGCSVDELFEIVDDDDDEPVRLGA